MPLHALAQFERYRLTIRAHGVAFGKHWDHFAVIVVIEKTFIDLWHDETNRSGR